MQTSVKCPKCEEYSDLAYEADGIDILEMWILDTEDTGKPQCANPDCGADFNTDDLYEAAQLDAAGG